MSMVNGPIPHPQPVYVVVGLHIDSCIMVVSSWKTDYIVTREINRIPCLCICNI